MALIIAPVISSFAIAINTPGAKMRNKIGNIELFNYGVNFYKNEMNIINIFNLIF